LNRGDAGRRSGGVALWRPGRAVRALARGAIDDFVTTLFPGECRVCEAALVCAGATPVCGDCLAGVLPQKGLLCEVCGEALVTERGMESERFAESFGEAGMCAPCRRVPPEFRRAVAYGVYEGKLREMVHLLKYERMTGLGQPLGRMLAGAMELLGDEISAAAGEVLVVAVPLFRAKERGRGFNHAAMLADGALRELKRRRPEWKMRAAHDGIERVRETESQFGLTPRARRLNLRGAFAVRDADRFRGRDVLLVDDIYTTGATARACARVLRRAGARSVLVATLARAQVKSVAMWDAAAVGSSPIERFGEFAMGAGGHR